MAAPNNGKSLPLIPSHLPGYKDSIEEQLVFLEEMEKNNIFTNKFKLAEMSDKKLKEAIYYTQQLKIPKKEMILQEELARRITLPFRPPIMNRPDMPEEALIPGTDYLNLLIRQIYEPKNSSHQQEAYHKFIDVFLTDWTNRKGYINSKGQQMAHTPYFDDLETLKGIQLHIEKILKKIEDKQKPLLLTNRRGNSIRQQLFKDILKRIKNRVELLEKEKFNKETRSARELTERIKLLEKRDENEREERGKKKGGRRTHKKIYAKRRKTRRS